MTHGSEEICDTVDDEAISFITYRSHDHHTAVVLLPVGVEVEGVRALPVRGVDVLANLLGVRDDCGQVVVDEIGRVDLDVHDRDHDEHDREDDHGVDVGGDECGLETTGGGVQDDAPEDEEGGELVLHPSEGLDGRGASE